MDLFSNHLVEECFAWVCRHAEFRPIPAFADPAHKYIIRSGLQKAIRRGQTDRAVELALKLYRIDPSYVWSALVTVAVEDIGAGNPDAVLWATMAQTTTFRRAVGEVALLIALARSLSASTKCRLACELPYVTDRSQHGLFRAFGQLSKADLLTRVAARDPVEAYVSLAILRGKTPSGLRIRLPDRSEFGEVSELFGDLLPDTFARAATAAFLRPVDEMSVAILPAFRIHCRSEETTRRDVMPRSVEVSGYASEAYDQHERTGRKALSAFSSRLDNLDPVIKKISHEARKRVVMDGVFVVEGQIADIRWAGWEREIYRAAFDDFMLTRHGISVDHAHCVRAAIEVEIPSLNEHRIKAAKTAGFC